MRFGKMLGRLGKLGVVNSAQTNSFSRSPRSPLQPREFTFNPGALRMFAHVPSWMADRRSLVVVLHGCGQTATGYEYGAGWSTLSERYGFALLFPEQQQSNNPKGCFNWFEPADTQRDSGEAASIRAMVDQMIRDYDIDRDSVFVTGLSAGGAMTSVMLACYPEVFSGGAIIAGLPYGAARNVQQAFQSMLQCPSRPAREWGDLVRQASPRHNGPWPRISVWHGNADQIVVPSNAREILKQWTDVHRLPPVASAKSLVDGYPREVWKNEAGDEMIESYTITRMAHGTPLATSNDVGGCGSAGPFLLEAGISSSYHIAKFFGLTTSERPSNKARTTSGLAVRPYARGTSADQPEILEGELLEPETVSSHSKAETGAQRVDIESIITKALTAAGLMKR